MCAILGFGILLLAGYQCGSESAAASTLNGTWSYTGSLNSPRSEHTVTRLQDGRVLVAGGSDGTSSLSSSEIYDPTTGVWSPASSMNEARGFHSATLLSSGKALVVGGMGTSSCPASAEIYDPVTNAWLYTSGTVKERYSHQATLLSDGRVLVTGGWQPKVGGGRTFCSEVDIYDPSAASWTGTGLHLPRVDHTATLLPDGQVLLSGGYDNEFLDDVRLYDPSTNNLVNTGVLNTRRNGHSATFLSNGTVLVAGGQNWSTVGGPGLTSAEVYSPATGNWSYTGSMNAGRPWHSATRLPNGFVLVAGGYNFTGGADTIASSELYDPATGVWSATDSLNESRAGRMVSLTDGEVLFPGGSSYSGDSFSRLSSVEIYEYEPTTPILSINYGSGAPDSFFTLTGSNFPPNSTATVTVNGQTLGTVSTDADGSLTFLLSTTSADEGSYYVTVTGNPSATVSFVLDSNEPIRPQDGSGSVLDVPEGIAFTESVFIPIVLR